MIQVVNEKYKEGLIDALKLLSRVAHGKNNINESIEVTSNEGKKGMVDALNTIKKIKTRGINVHTGNVKKGPLKLPQNVEGVNIVDNDEKNSSEVYDTTHLTPEEQKLRAEKLKSLNDDGKIADDIEEVTREINRRQDAIKKAQEEAEARKKSLEKAKSFDMFKSDLLDAVISQISPRKTKYDTYAKMNKTTGNTGLIRQGVDRHADELLPTFCVFLDRSGSMSGSKMKAAESAIKFLYDLQDEGKLIIDEWWAADDFGPKGTSVGWGNSEKAIYACVKKVKEKNYQNVIFFTDSDWEYPASKASAPSVKVPGIVYFV